jgi:saccharopine dehydrogenase-like NADP-dependent oxidoreductase
MQELDAAAKRKQFGNMNEIGLDPGIDHMSAKVNMRSDKGGKELLFESFVRLSCS